MPKATADAGDDAPDFVVSGPSDNPRRIACRASGGRTPTIVWLGGYRSDMNGTKAERLAAFAQASGFGFCRFDYSGHGQSSGRFRDGTVSAWIEDARAVLATLAPPFILVGSSMGAWIALRLAQDAGRNEERQQIAGMLLLAPAPDFTRRLVEPALTRTQREDLIEHGFCTEPSAYAAEPNIFTRALLDDGERNLVMTGPVETRGPIRIIQGMADPDVPFTHALDLVACLPAADVTLTLVPDGDHRLSRAEDLTRMERALAELLNDAQPA